MKTNVRLFDQNENKYDLVVGEDNPVIPAVGDEVVCGLGKGNVKSRTFTYEELRDGSTVLLVTLHAYIPGEPARDVSVTWL